MATVGVRYIVEDVDAAIYGSRSARPEAAQVDDLDATVEELRGRGARFRSDIITGVGGKQVLIEDPSGNPIELFEPTRPEASLSAS
jgi:hypothetical protein